MPSELRNLTLDIHATALRPLLGLTVLVVEDSRFASEAIRLLCIRSGARIRRADCLQAAHKHLRVYRPSVVLIDLGLPDGSGIDLITELAREEAGARPVILATSGADGEGLGQQAMLAGADDFLPKPVEALSAFQQAILQHLPNEMRPSGPRLVSDEIVHPDPLTLREDLSHLDDLLKTGPDTLGYVAPFLQGLARLSGDKALKSASDALSSTFNKGGDVKAPILRIRQLIRERLSVSELV